ncbi:hypothetical protein [Lactococcus termiticola]|uniref:Uncharacterized protein n=1 Tax=Lactococcus termiticola TaxID=2169526 RepID=A0A2R5HEB4_9LACT|nr:hypothetical protein [Lactococcus termiticola]GBG96359.1 hypothetical protein NtB2_00470 [Lactococcus termiticola]
MNYELVTLIRPGDAVWDNAKKRLQADKGEVISILPSPDFAKILKNEDVKGVNLFDEKTGRTTDLNNFMFFNQAPVPSNSEIFMNGDWTISVINNGDEIGNVELYPNTRRFVKNVSYKRMNGDTDYIQEYAIDGKLFSEIFYFNNKPQEIHFYSDEKVPRISYYFYEGNLDYVTLNDEKGEMGKGFKSLDEMLGFLLSEKLTADDTVTVTYMGMEINVLSQAKSHNQLYLEESPLTEEGQVKGNLQLILDDNIPYIHEVFMSQEHYLLLVEKGVSTKKVRLID